MAGGWRLTVRSWLFRQENALVVQGHPRSMILVPIESTYACDFLLVHHSNFVLYIVSFQRYSNFLAQKLTPTPILPELWGVSSWPNRRCWGLSEQERQRSYNLLNLERLWWNIKLISRENIFEVFQPMWWAYLKCTLQTERTDGPTTYSYCVITALREPVPSCYLFIVSH